MRRPKRKENAQRKCPATYIARTLVYADSYRFCLKTLIFSLGFASDRSNIYLIAIVVTLFFLAARPKTVAAPHSDSISKSH